jgi:ankyrin repeat protein
MASANERLCDAADRGDVAGIAAALLAGADLEALDGAYVMTPLQWAAYTGHVAAIAALLAAGARVDGTDLDGSTPLIYAAIHGHTSATDALLAAGADMHRVDRNGDTALHLTSSYSHVDAARLLLDAGARADVRSNDNKRPIDVVRTPARSLDAPASYCHAAALPHRHAQACQYRDMSARPAVRALFASAAPWSRRRPVAVACYGVEWEWEA